MPGGVLAWARLPPTLQSRLRPWRWVPFALLFVALLQLSSIPSTLDQAFFDLAQRRPARPLAIPADSAIVLVDDEAMRKLGQEPLSLHWPFSRNALSAMILALHKAGARQIVMDFTFIEQSPAIEQDMLLAAVAAATPGCLLARSADAEPVFWNEEFRKANPAHFGLPRTGLVTYSTDDDGVLRRVQLASSLVAAALPERGTDAKEPQLLRWAGGLAELKAQGVPVQSVGGYVAAGLPMLEQVAELAPEMDTASVAKAIAQLKTPPEWGTPPLLGRTVFVGANAHGTFDTKPLPVGDGIEPGTLALWTAWANLKDGTFVRSHGWGWKLISVCAAVLLVGLSGRGRSHLLVPSLTAVAGILLVLAGSYLLLSSSHFFPPFTFVFAAGLALLCLVASNFLHEQSRKREIQTIFGSYVDPAVVQLLVHDPAAVRMGGERREASVLFSDLAGFTDLSEKMPAEKLLEVINLYLEQVSEALLSNGAYIDKYIGDAVMAVYGAPLPRDDHALAACEGALAAQEVMARLAPRFLQEHGCHVHMRVGVNTGELILGNMGSERKRNYTVLGDPVNLASRLEGANKEFGTAIMIGELTARRVQSHFLTRPLALLRVKGKLEAIEVHELVGRRGSGPHPDQEFLTRYSAGFSALLRRDFAAAAAYLSEALRHKADDKMTQHWLAQAQLNLRQEAPADWTPLIKLDSK